MRSNGLDMHMAGEARELIRECQCWDWKRESRTKNPLDQEFGETLHLL